MTTIAKFLKDPKHRTVYLEFTHPNLSAPDISAALSKFESELHLIGEDDNYDFLVIKTDEGLNNSAGLHALFIEEMNVKEISRWEKIIVYIERMRKVTMMALPKHVDDMLFQLALVCDFCFCLPDTKFQFRSIKSGYLPGMAVFRLAKYIGLGRAKRILFRGIPLKTKTAYKYGIVQEIVTDLDLAIKQRLDMIKPVQVEAILMARAILTESFHDSYEEEIGNYLAAQVRCFENINKTVKENN